MFERFDGTGRTPRSLQITALRWLQENWKHGNLFALNLPTGVGKSAILRALQLQFPGTHGIIPTNALLDQYADTYPDANVVRGLEHYDCNTISGQTCKDTRDEGLKCTDKCASMQAIRRARTEPTLFNPFSYYFNVLAGNIEASEHLVIDEAHRLSESLTSLVDIRLKYTDLGISSLPTSFAEVFSCLSSYREELSSRLRETSSGTKKAKLLRRTVTRLNEIQDTIKRSQENFVYFEESAIRFGRRVQYLAIQPIRCPKELLDKFFNQRKSILLSATMPSSLLAFLGYKALQYFDSDSPIDPRQRKLTYSPIGATVNFHTSPSKIASWISAHVSAAKSRGVLVHVSYSWQAKLAPFFPNALVNTPKNKTAVLRTFRETGGLWLAAGCGEGLDLKDDECRLVLIPIVIKPHPDDPVVRKQLSLAGGTAYVEGKLLTSIIQQSGRAVRHEGDYADIIIGDPAFPRLFLRNAATMPKSFKDAIQWGYNV